MAYADRITLILGFLWATFLTLLLGPASNPYAFSPLWWEGMALLVGIPVAVVWIVLRLALGNRGAVYRPRKPRPKLKRDAYGNVVWPPEPEDGFGPTLHQ